MKPDEFIDIPPLYTMSGKYTKKLSKPNKSSRSKSCGALGDDDDLIGTIWKLMDEYGSGCTRVRDDTLKKLKVAKSLDEAFSILIVSPDTDLYMGAIKYALYMNSCAAEHFARRKFKTSPTFDGDVAIAALTTTLLQHEPGEKCALYRHIPEVDRGCGDDDTYFDPLYRFATRNGRSNTAATLAALNTINKDSTPDEIYNLMLRKETLPLTADGALDLILYLAATSEPGEFHASVALNLFSVTYDMYMEDYIEAFFDDSDDEYSTD